jgi:hypothetical protein
MKTTESKSIAGKTLDKIVLHGSERSKRTGWQFWSAFVMAHFTDGSTKYMGDISHNEAVAQLTAIGVNTTAFLAREKEQTESRKRRFAERFGPYPPKPESATEYQHNYGYETPTALGEWQWSTTFGRWGRIVTFADGWNGFTYPRI